MNEMAFTLQMLMLSTRTRRIRKKKGGRKGDRRKRRDKVNFEQRPSHGFFHDFQR
jgi:hypothetical protein